MEPWAERKCGGKGTASSVLSSCSRSFLAVRLRIWSWRRWFSCCREWSDCSISTTRGGREEIYAVKAKLFPFHFHYLTVPVYKWAGLWRALEGSGGHYKLNETVWGGYANNLMLSRMDRWLQPGQSRIVLSGFYLRFILELLLGLLPKIYFF